MSSNNFWNAPPSKHFTEVVNAYESNPEETIYNESINRMKLTNLKALNSKDVDSILNPFFLKWGRMGRVLGFEGCIKIGEILKEMNEDLLDVRYYSLGENLNKVPNISKLYDKIRYAEFKSSSNNRKCICSTATSKALHLVAPDFFVMWDDPIRNFYEFNDEGKEYQKFIVNMNLWINALNPTITSLSEQFKKTKTKILDEFNWYRIRPWWHENEWKSI